MTPTYTYQVHVIDDDELHHWSQHQYIQDASDELRNARERHQIAYVFRVDWPQGGKAGMVTDVTADADAYLRDFYSKDVWA